ncbi:MAG: hypothetical protein WA705_11285 [Candidatus Ozemobacteraceae bacterium]
MIRISPKYRPWVFLFALWLAFEPLAVSIARAGDAPTLPTVETKSLEETDGIADINEVMTPAEYLEYMLELRGMLKEDLDDPAKSKAAAEEKAWADWMTSISSIYQMMGSQEADVFGYYSSASSIHKTLDSSKDDKDIANEVRKSLPKMVKFLSNASKKAVMMFAYLGDGALSMHGCNLLKAFAKSSEKAAKALEKSHSFTFLEFLSCPTTALAQGSKLTESQQYWRWCKKVVGKGDNKFTIANYKGVARTIGIGLEIIGFALDVHHLATSDDVHGGRLSSYDTVSTGISALLGAGALICMFVPGGQIVAVACLIYLALTQIAGVVGSYNAKWKESYKNSYWFLYENDPTFKSFYDNRANLKKEEKAASYLIAERDFGEKLSKQTPQTEGETAQFNRGNGIFQVLEKQGVLMTYYNQVGFTLPDFDTGRLQDLWNKKASFMSWKPNESELAEEKERGFFGNALHVINPMTYVAWAGDKIASRGFKNEIKNQDIKRVFFNPDYVLVKKYKNFLMGRNLRGGLYDVVGMRMEQSPWNYIPLVGIDSGAWSDALFEESFQADSLIIGAKEMTYFREQAKMANEGIKKSLEESEKSLKSLDQDFLPAVRKQREALQKLVGFYKDAPDGTSDSLYQQCHDAFGWEWNTSYGQKTPKNLVAHYKADIEQKLEFIPLSVGQKAAETVILAAAAKQVRDTVKLMRVLQQDREETLNNFDKEFKNDAIRKYLKEGTFLDVKGSTTLDWLGGLYPAWEELRKYTQLFKNEVDDYEKLADKTGANHEVGHLWWKTTIRDPKTVLADLNKELKTLKETVVAYESLDGADLEIAVQSANAGVYPDGGFKMAVDPDAELNLNDEVTYQANPVMPSMAQ